MTELSGYVFSALRGGEFTLYRGSGDGLEPILLVAPIGEYPAGESLKRLEHEHDLKAKLDAGWAVRPLALSRHDGRMALVLEDPGGEPLDRLLGQPMDVTEFLRIAIPLAAAIGQVHVRGLIHKDIKPANILVDVASGGVWLTGFGIASRLPREHQAAATPPDVIAGTLAYMAPEQTGRMNRSIDARSDLYSLGISFYEMLTGTLPFTAADPMEWVHCHIARQPASPDDRVAGIPGPLSAIVMKLLAKTAEDRYQTAAGVEADLRCCLADWEANHRIDPFPPGSHDTPDRLLIPEKLYGREAEIDTLVASFDRVIASGTPELVLVSGYSGIGKSSVVNELHKVLVPPRGLFASGKFEQYKRDIPYATLAQALRTLVRQILVKSEAEVDQWRRALTEAVGPNGQLIVSLVPELEVIIGKQLPVPDLPPRDAQNRFQSVFRRFISAFARPEHPLALFLDDLQWLDAATLDLLEHLVTHPEVRHLLLVGAYRDNEVGPSHPLLRTLEAIRNVGAPVQAIVLAPLGLADVGQLIADAMHREPERVRPLAQLVQEKTGGNPFFAIQFFTALAEEGLLAFDPATRAWRWDMDRIRAKNYTDNVVDLMVGKLSRLPEETQDALKLLACLGNTAAIATLSMMRDGSQTENPEQATHAALWEAVRAGLVFRLDSAYAFPHDRIQQAAYSLIPDAQRAGVHLRIGRVLLANMTADELAENLFDVANQLNRGAEFLVEPNEQAQVAEIDLRAGRKAKASAAYEAACLYLAAGMALLDDSRWGRHYALMFSLWLECAECEFLRGNLDETERLVAILLQRGASKVDLESAYHLKILLHVVKSENPRAVDSALTCLRLFGIDLPAHPTWEQVQAEYETVSRHLEGRPIEDLIDLPLMTDTDLLAAMRLLSVLCDPAYVTDQNLLCLELCRAVNLGIRHGVSGAFAHACTYLGWPLATIFRRYPEGFRLAKLGYDLVEKHAFLAYRSKVQDATGIAAFWTQPMATSIDFVRASFRTALETGDLTYACYAQYHTITLLLLRNEPLDVVEREAEIARDFVRNAKFRDMEDTIVPQQRFIAMMQGRTASISTFNDAQFDEGAFEAQLMGGRMPTMICWYWIMKAKARFLAGEHAEALAAIDKATALLWSSTGHFPLIDYYYYAALTVAALYENASAVERPRWRELLELRDQLREWADVNRPSFGDKHALVSAEVARLEGREPAAMRLYEEAVALARAHGFVQNEGLAYERAASFYATRGFETFATAYLRNARYCYLCWGADGKVRQLDRLHPHLAAAEGDRSTATMGSPIQQLDVASVVKASQAMSSEIELPKLIERLMTIAIENAGADRGLLILPAKDDHLIQAEARASGNQVDVALCQNSITAITCPESLVRYVIRTHESVILDDSSRPNLFSDDEYLRGRQTKSVLCLPLLKQGQLTGLLYLENTLTSHAFAPDRIAVLELLAAQAAISLENTRLYGDLQEREAKVRRLIDSDIIGIFIWDIEGRIFEANEALLHMVGHSRDDLVSGRVSWTELTPAEWRDADEQGLAEIVATGTCKPFEKEYFRKDGSRVPVLIGAATFGGHRDQGVAFVLDLTERKRAEDALRESEQRFRDYAETASDWLWETGPDHRFIHLSEQLAAIGISPAHRIGLRRWDFATDLDEEPEKWRLHVATLEARRPFRGFVFRVKADDGSAHYIAASGKPVFDAEGRFLGYRGVGSDVTAAVRAEQAEEALRQSQTELAHVTRVTTLGELTASIAHEVNQPLAAIVTNGEVGLQWLDREVPDLAEVRETLGDMIRNGRRAGEIIQRLRALSGKTETQKAALDINDVIREVIPLVHQEVLRHRVSLSLELAPTLPAVLGDRVQLQQVIINLLVNGMEAMAPVADRPREMVVRSQLDGNGQVLVAVQDSGVGIDPDNAKQLFNAFFTTKPSGMGMGLSICRSIIQAHDGTLWASRNAGPGATFQFTLPSRQEAGP